MYFIICCILELQQHDWEGFMFASKRALLYIPEFYCCALPIIAHKPKTPKERESWVYYNTKWLQAFAITLAALLANNIHRANE
jgi:hypothetical protein